MSIGRVKLTFEVVVEETGVPTYSSEEAANNLKDLILDSLSYPDESQVKISVIETKREVTGTEV